MKNGALIEASMVALGGIVIPLAATEPAYAQEHVYDFASGVTSIVGAQLTSSTNGVLVSGGGTTIMTNTSNYMSGVVTVDDNSTLAFNYDSVLGATSAIVLGSSNTSGVLDFNEIYSSGSTTSNFQLSSSLVDDRGILINQGGGVIITNSGTVYSASSSTASVTSSYWTELEGVISGTGLLTVTGGGQLELNANNVWTGSTLVESGSTLGVTRSGSLGAITNSLTLDDGTLEFLAGGKSYDNAIILVSSGTPVTTISSTNSGNIIDAETYTNTISSIITGSGGLEFIGNSLGGGEVILTADEQYTGGTVVNGGTLLLSGGSLLGDVTVTSAHYYVYTLSGSGTSETVSVTSYTTYGNLGGIGTVSGSVFVTSGASVTPGIKGSGALTIDTDLVVSSGGNLLIQAGSGGVGEVVVNGDATFDSGSTLKLDYAGYAKPGTYTYLDVSGVTTGGFSSATTVDDLYSAGLESNVTSNTVTLTQLSALPKGDLPSLIADTTNLAIDDAQFANRFVLDRLQSTRLTVLAQREQVALSDHHQVRNLSPYGFWVTPLGGFGSASGSDGAPGYSTTKYGFAMGYDGVAGPGWVYGGALSYQHDRLTQSGGSNASSDTPRLQVYGGWWRGPYAVDFTFGDGWDSMTTHRNYAAALTNVLYGVSTTTDFSGTANGTRSANELTAAAQFSANYLIGYKWALSPAAGVKFARVTILGMTEGGTDYFGYVFAKQNVNSVRPFIDVAGSRRFYFINGTALVPEVRLGVEDEVGETSRDLTVMTYGDDYNWVVPGQKPDSVALDVDLGVAYETSKTQSFSIKFMGTEGSSTRDQTFLAQYGLRF